MFRRIVTFAVLGNAFVACSLFVSVDDLNGGMIDASASDSSSALDSPVDVISKPDASVDAGVDASAPYLIVDPCVEDDGEAVNLTTAGSIDWAHYGSDADVKNVATHLIGTLMQSVNGNNPYSDDSRMFSWTDGTLVATVASTSNGIFDDTGPMMLPITATPTRSVITIYLNTYSLAGSLRVSMSPGAPAVSQAVSGTLNVATRFRCAVHFGSPVAAEVDIQFSIADAFDATGGNLAMIAATLGPDPN
jgi:archaellum component FlaG (FlaF/FlaG flagellin family)